MKQVMVQFDIPGMTAKQYEQIWQDLRTAGYANPKGMQYHFGASAANGWVVVEIWESADLLKEFGKILMPILTKYGFPQDEGPLVLPLHYVYSGK